MRMNLKRIFLLSSGIIGATGIAGALVYTNTQRTKALSPIITMTLLQPYSQLSFLNWFLDTERRIGEKYGKGGAVETIFVNGWDLRKNSYKVDSVQVTAHLELNYSYVPVKRNLFRQDYVDWHTIARTYVLLPNGEKVWVNNMEQNLSTHINGIGAPSLQFGLSLPAGANFGSSLSIGWNSVTERLTLDNTNELTSISKDRAWIWAYWGFSQNLKASFRIKNKIFSYITKDGN